MTELITLQDARHRLTLVPQIGGAIAGAEALTPQRAVPILRPRCGDGPFDQGCNVLVPFSNRISGGGFTFGGRFHALAPNLQGEPYPIHGDGFQAVWQVVAQTSGAVELTHRGRFGPFDYLARLRYALEEGIRATLSVTNLGPALPLGGGFHPWFPREASTRLAFAASGVWSEGPDHLPRAHLPLSSVPDWDFRKPRALPAPLINAAFTGWHGPARIDQPDAGLVVTVDGSPNLSTALVYSPGDHADFFCFEPVSHAVDAHNQPGQPGLAVLQPGETMVMAMRIGWQPLP